MRYVTLLVLACSSLWSAERWQMQYFYDQNKEELHFTAIAFCSAARGVATGVLVQDGKPKPSRSHRPMAAIHWTLTETKEAGHALFFLDETSGWMVTSSGIWFTDECGRTWRRIYKQRGLTDIRFVSPDRGWAIGANKTVIETTDGGKTWQKVKAVEELDSDPERTTFTRSNLRHRKSVSWRPVRTGVATRECRCGWILSPMPGVSGQVSRS